MNARAAKRPSRPLGTGRGWRRRLLRHHAPLALGSTVVLAVFVELPLFAVRGSHGDITTGTFPQSGGTGTGMGQTGSGTAVSFLRQSTVATGYLALGLLALTLLIGPASLLLRRRNPVSSYLRRDVGTWTAIASVLHVVLGFRVHGTGQVLDYFVRDGAPLLNSFGLGNWTGLAALVIVVMLFALSTDSTLRELKASTWKDLQRLNYILFVLVILHAFFYGALLRTASPFTVLLLVTVIAVVIGQSVGIWLWRRRSTRSGRIHNRCARLPGRAPNHPRRAR
jgi:sulfoxide reductase heme-binding subunit YedZ